MKRFVEAAFALSFMLAPPAAAENWPQFRGPTGQGVSAEKDPPLEWSSSKNIAWKTEIPGDAWSSPIVWGDRAFVTTATDGGKSCRIVALDFKSGAILWNKEVFRQSLKRKEGRNTYATPTPATDGERVYACFGDGSFAATTFAGEIAWTNRDYPFYSQHGLGSSLVLHDGLLLMARDGSSEGPDKGVGWQTPWDQAYVVALDAKTGKERWKTKRGRSRISHGTPVILNSPEGKTEVVSEAGDVLQGMDFATGKLKWTSEVIGEGKAPSVVLGDGLAFASGGWGGKATIKAFKLGGAGELKESNLVWEQKKGMPNIPSMVCVSPHLYAVTDAGVATCLKGESGEVVWQNRLGGNFAASPVAAAGRIYFFGDRGDTTVVETGPTFKTHAKN
ncbi:MAG TPA: PQQ-binding-like beta-propeller repeat protein [Planctomycetia bacterium]|nr:PQQ-binding-like beta-propeller repeat protein [Planctomycetia bacterium]